MKKFLSLMMILSLITVFCITSCDQEQGNSASSGSNGGGKKTTVAIKSFTISPSGTINMTVDETKDFTIIYSPDNATVTNILSDLTYDMDNEFFYPVSQEYIKFDSTAHSITITVRAKKAGSTTISASLISNKKINGSVNFVISDGSGDDSSSSSGSSADSSSSSSSEYDSSSSSGSSGDSSSSSSSSGDEGGQTTADVTTLNITVNVSDVTIDDIFGLMFYYGFGDYEERKIYNNADDPIIIAKTDMTDFNKTGDKQAVIKFKIETDDIAHALFPTYFQIQFVNRKNSGCGNLQVIHQEEARYTKKSVYNITETITGQWEDQGINLNTGS